MKNNIFITIKKELRAIIRDKKSLAMMLVTPIMIPLFILFFSYMYDDMLNEDETINYTLGINYKLNNIEKEIIDNLSLDVIEYKNLEELENAYKNNKIDAYTIKDNDKYLIYSNELIQDSSITSSLVTTYLDTYNDYLANNYLISIGADINKVYSNINYEFKNLDGNNDLADEIINLAFMFAIMSIALTAIYCATDTIAGEKERGTLETFLTFPIKSEEIIIGKYLAITIACIITSIISIILSIGTISISHTYFELYNEVIFNFSFLNISLVFIIMVLYSLFISGLSIAIASFAKSYKEAQSLLTPLSFLTIVPMFLNILEININPIISLIPVINHTLIINDIFHNNIIISNIIIIIISTICYVILLIMYLEKQYKSEKILFS